jgi:hypothetical protein
MAAALLNNRARVFSEGVPVKAWDTPELTDSEALKP